jgi:hypothetical protein
MNVWSEYFEESGEDWIAASTNEERADWAEAAVLAFRSACKGDFDETALYDLVANLGHLCDRLSATYKEFDLTFEQMVESARAHYEAETGEGDDIEQGWRS